MPPPTTDLPPATTDLGVATHSGPMPTLVCQTHYGVTDSFQAIARFGVTFGFLGDGAHFGCMP